MSFSAPNDFQSTGQDRVLGLFILVAIVIGAAFLWFRYHSNQAHYWNSYHTVLSNSYGIVAGANVSFRGVAIGEIERVAINDSGMVKVDLLLDKEFEAFYTEGSYLEIKSELGLDTVLSGAGFSFISAGRDKPRLDEQGVLHTEEPQSFKDLLDEWNAEEIASQVSNIVTNLDNVVTNISDNQERLIETLNAMSTMSQSLMQSTEKLPSVIENVNRVTEDMSALMTSLNQGVSENANEVKEVIGVAKQLTQEITELSASFKPAANGSEGLVNNLTLSAVKLNQLIDKLNQHWLLSNGKNVPNKRNAVLLPSDSYLDYDDRKHVESKNEE